MDLKDLILLMWRNIRYIVLGLALGAGIGIFVSKIQAPVYEAGTKVFISRARQQGNSDMLSLSDEQLLAINLQLTKSQPVLDDVSSQLGSKVDADNIQVGAIPNTLIIQIKVQDTDPQRAAAIANLLVQILIQQNETLLSGRYMGFESAINEQVDLVQKQIEGLQTQINQINNTGIQEQLTQVNQQIEQLKVEISVLEQDIASFPDSPTPLERVSLAEKEARLAQLHSLMTLYQQIQTNLTYIGKPVQNGSSLENPQLTTLQSTLGLYQQINTTLINSRENIRLARAHSKQNIMQIVSATPPKNPVRPMPVLYFLLGGVVGLALTVTAILMIEHLDDSLKSVNQIKDLLDLSVLGFVFEDKHPMVISQDPISAEAEAFRALGASVEVAGAKKNLRSLMIMNAEPTDAKTTIAANLAIINAQQGKRVILLDADLKHPHLHNLFGLENKNGFAELLNGEWDLNGASHVVKDVEGLTLIPSGVMEKESKTWLNAKKWEQLLLKLQKQADLVIVDSPRADVADAQILASKVNAVLLAIKPGHTRIEPAQTTLKRLQLTGVWVMGIVWNRTQLSRLKILPLVKIKLPHRKDTHEINGETRDIPVSPS